MKGKVIDIRAYKRFRNALEKYLTAYLKYPDYQCRQLICRMAIMAAENFGVKRMRFPQQRSTIVNGRIIVPQPGGWRKAKGGPDDVA